MMTYAAVIKGDNKDTSSLSGGLTGKLGRCQASGSFMFQLKFNIDT